MAYFEKRSVIFHLSTAYFIQIKIKLNPCLLPKTILRRTFSLLLLYSINNYKVKGFWKSFKLNKWVGKVYILSLDIFNLLNEVLHNCRNWNVIILTKTQNYINWLNGTEKCLDILHNSDAERFVPTYSQLVLEVQLLTKWVEIFFITKSCELPMCTVIYSLS